MKSKEPSVTELTELYKAAAEFQKLQPWRWMYDSHLFGVKNPASDEIGYCCVMGNAGQHYAMGVYLGAEGLGGYLRMAEGQWRDDDPLQFQKCLMASFEDRSTLSERDLKTIKKLGLKFRGRNAWTQFRSYRPGYFPWYLTPEECRFLTLALQQAIDVAARFKENPELLEMRGDALLVRVPQQTSEGLVWEDQYLEPEPYDSRWLVLDPKDARLDDFKKEVPRGRSVWEADFFYGEQPVTGEEEDRPYFPVFMLWCDRDSQMVLHVHLGKPKTYTAEFQTEFLNLAYSMRMFPAEVQVSKREAAELLEPFLSKLGVRLKLVRNLKALQRARREVFRRFAF